MEDFLNKVTQHCGTRTPEITTPRQPYQPLNTYTPRRVLPTQLSFSGRDFDFSSAGTSKSSSCVSSGLPSPTEYKTTDISQLMDLDGRMLMNKLHEKRIRNPNSPTPSQPVEIVKAGEGVVQKSPDGYTSEDETTLCEDIGKNGAICVKDEIAKDNDKSTKMETS